MAAARRFRALTAVAVVACVGTATGLMAQAPSRTPAPFSPGVADLMSMIVQPRHLKLGLAAHAGNWTLAEYELKELQDAFARTARTHPVFKGFPLSEVIAAAVDAPIRQTGDAIKAKDAAKFEAAYAQLTDGCNKCHVALDHPFVVIKRPEQPAFPNQEFTPAR